MVGKETLPDDKILEALYVSQMTPLYRYFFYHVGNMQDAEDLVSITLYRAIANHARFDAQKGTLAAWVFGVARHVLRDNQRRRTGLTLPHLPLVDTQSSPELQVIQDEATMLLHQRIHKLPANQREALTLRYFGDLHIHEIAALLRKSDPAVKMLLQRGLANLRCQYHHGGER